MASRADTFLKLSLALAALIAGAGVGYYYGLFLPAQAERAEQRLAAAEKARADAEAKAKAEEARAREAARNQYQDCLNFADLGYRNRWTQACRGQHAADVAAYQDCVDDLFSTQEGCRRAHPIRPEQDCNLPSDIAQTLTSDRDRAKALCLGPAQGLSGSPVPSAAPGI